jgi:D-serine deaminase-like pyridoxal phosphate-dependent protein
VTDDALRASGAGPRHYRALLRDLPVELDGVDPFAGDLASPLALLRESRVEANIASMQRWCTERGIQLAPHGKTTMSPHLFARQLAAGAWGITVAGPAQARVALDAGAARILIANEVTDVAGIRWLGRTRQQRPDLFLTCYVDAVAGVGLLEEHLAGVLPDGQRLDVLVELGLPGGRTGARSEDDAVAVARAVAASRRLRLAGVSGYEGVAAALGGDRPLAAVADFCSRLGALAERLVADGLLLPSVEHPLVLSAGGSAWFDAVVPALAAARERLGATPAVVVLRSGAYVTHDHGLYSRVTPAARGGNGPELLPALEVWGRVLSRPEPTRAVVDVGRRDAPFDQDLPFALWRKPATGGPSSALTARVLRLDDQHAYLEVAADEVLTVGEWVGFGISHPCTAVDKWNVLLLVDDRERIVAQLPTFF